MTLATGSTNQASNPSLAWMEVSAPVDVFDATARLEASGTGDIKALKNGFTDVFDQARSQFKPPAVNEQVPVPMPNLPLSIWRAVALASGILICLTLVSPSVGPVETFGAGAGCWLSAQITSSVLWWGKNEAQQWRAARAAIGILFIEFSLASGISFSTTNLAVPGWIFWGWASAVGLCWLPTRRFSTACALAATLAWVVRIGFGVDAGVVLATAIVLLAVAAGVRALLETERTAGEPVNGMGISAAWATACAVAQLVSIALAYRSLGIAFIALAIGAIISTTVSESTLEITGYLVKAVVAKTHSWRSARVAATLIGLGCVGLMIGVSVLAGVLFAGAWKIPITDEFLVLSALISVIGTGVGISMRLGLIVTAAGVAAGGAIATGVVTSGIFGSNLTFGLVLTSGAALVSASRVASPKAW